MGITMKMYVLSEELIDFLAKETGRSDRRVMTAMLSMMRGGNVVLGTAKMIAKKAGVHVNKANAFSSLLSRAGFSIRVGHGAIMIDPRHAFVSEVGPSKQDIDDYEDKMESTKEVREARSAHGRRLAEINKAGALLADAVNNRQKKVYEELQARKRGVYSPPVSAATQEREDERRDGDGGRGREDAEEEAVPSLG